MENVTFHLREMNQPPDAQDLENALTGISGVAGLQVDVQAGTVSVRYDPHYVGPSVLSGSIEGSGYLLKRDEHAREVPT